MKRKTTNLIIDLTWSETLGLGAGAMAEQKVFKIEFCRSCKTNNFEVKAAGVRETKKLISYLEKFKINHKVGDYFISIDFESDIFVQPCHHIELRVRKY